jgi:hypothetical protein
MKVTMEGEDYSFKKGFSSFFFFFFLFKLIFETSHYVLQPGLYLMILLPQPPECRDWGATKPN